MTVTLLSLPLAAIAAEVGGSVKTASNRLAKGAIVVLTCDGTPFEAETNGFGRFRIKKLPDVTWCDLTVSYGEKDTVTPERVSTGHGSKEINVRLRSEANGWSLVL